MGPSPFGTGSTNGMELVPELDSGLGMIHRCSMTSARPFIYKSQNLKFLHAHQWHQCPFVYTSPNLHEKPLYTKIYTQFFIPHILHSLPSVPPQRSCGRGQRSKSMGSPDLWSWSRCIPCDFQSPSLARLHPLLRPLCTGPQRHLVVATPPREKNEKTRFREF